MSLYYENKKLGIGKVDLATKETPGIVQIGDGLEVDADGIVSVAGGSEEIENIEIPLDGGIPTTSNSSVLFSKIGAKKIGKLVIVNCRLQSFKNKSSGSMTWIYPGILPKPDLNYYADTFVPLTVLIIRYYDNEYKTGYLRLSLDNNGSLSCSARDSNWNTIYGEGKTFNVNMWGEFTFSYICE